MLVRSFLEEDQALLAAINTEHPCKETQYNTKWALKVFRDWQSSRTEKNVEFNDVRLHQVDISNAQDLTCRIEDMSIDSLNFWLSKFVILPVHFLRILQWWGKTAKGPIFPVLPPRQYAIAEGVSRVPQARVG